MTTSDRAVKKASRERLLRDFARASRIVRATVEGEQRRICTLPLTRDWPRGEYILTAAQRETSRTRYACLMTAFGG